jgi:glycosyltransferase involved in cell wall biosynthesis
MINTGIEKKAILQVLPALESGGVERGVCDLANYAKKKNYEILVASAGGKMTKILEQNNITHINLNLKTKNPILIFINIFSLLKIIKKHNIQIIHARSRAPAWSAYYACKLSGKTFITTFHGFYKFSSMVKKAYNSIMAKGDEIIAVSNFIKDHILNNYPVSKNRVKVIHRGVDLAQFSATNISIEESDNFRKNIGVNANDFIVLLPGRITRWKGHITAIKAITKLTDINNLKLVICGSWEGKEEYFEELNILVSQENLEDRVIFTGNVSNMPLIYEISDIVLNCSTEPETFGRVTAEAGAMGKAVVATNIGGSKEIVIEGQTGHLVEPKNHEQLAERIRELYVILQNETAADRIGKVSRNHIKENFSLTQMCDKTLNTYDKYLEV